jgi:hypothetical protein
MNKDRERRREETAGQLSQALGAAAELMTERIQAASTVRQADPASPAPSGRRARGRLPGHLRSWMPGWLAPVAAAAAVAAVAAGSVFIAGTHVGATHPGSATGVPGFYVTLTEPTHGDEQVQVHRSSDGAVTGTLLAPSGWRMEAISAAASDRAFFVAEQSGTGLCPADRFVEFSVTGTGMLTGLHQVGVRVTGMIGSLAASPDGTRLAYITVCSTLANPGPVWVLHVMDLTSGAVSSWTSAATAAGTANVAEAGNQALAWAADGRSLSFAYQWMPSQAYFEDMAVVVVNTDSGGGTLQAHSRLVWHQDSNCAPGPCAFSAWISPDGTSLTAGALGGSAATPRGVAFSLERLALPAGRVTTVLFRTTVMGTGVGIPEPPAWGDSSGTYWIVEEGTSLGWVSNGRFHRMQPSGALQAAAW